MSIERRVRRLEVERGVDASVRCAVRADGARPSGIVYRFPGAPPGTLAADPVLPVCSGCGRCNPLIYDIVVAERAAAA